MARFWTARVDVDGEQDLHVLLPPGQVTVGRSPNAGLRVPEPWVSAMQAQLRFLPTGDWIVVNGTRTRMRLKSRRVWVTAQRGASALVEADPSAPATLTWPELDGRLEIHLQSGDGALPSLPGVRDHSISKRPVSLTGLALHRNMIEPALRHRMAVLFQYLIDEVEPPRNLYKHAASGLGDTEANLKAATHRLIERINRSRNGHRIEDLEALGYYLIHTSGAVQEADLAPPPGPD